MAGPGPHEWVAVNMAPVNPMCHHLPEFARTPSPRTFFSGHYPDSGVYAKLYSGLRAHEDPWNERNRPQPVAITDSPVAYEGETTEIDHHGDCNAGVSHGKNQSLCASEGFGNVGETGEAINLENLRPESTMGTIDLTNTPGSKDRDRTTLAGFDVNFQTPDRKTKPIMSPQNRDRDGIISPQLDVNFITPNRKTNSTMMSPMNRECHDGNESLAHTPSSHEQNGKTTVAKSERTVSDYSSNTSCVSRAECNAMPLGMSVQRVSNGQVTFDDVDILLTPEKVDWLNIVGNGRSSSSSRPYGRASSPKSTKGRVHPFFQKK